jgi:hypothetical protein
MGACAWRPAFEAEWHSGMTAFGQDRPFSPGQPNVRNAPKAVIRWPHKLDGNGGGVICCNIVGCQYPVGKGS